MTMLMFMLLGLGAIVSAVPLSRRGVLDMRDVCGTSGANFRSQSLFVVSSDVLNDEAAGKIWLERYNDLATVKLCESVVADWNYNTNLTDETLAISIKYSTQLAVFFKDAYDGGMSFNWQNFSEPVRREFSKVVDIGYASLSSDKFKRFGQIQSELQRIYSTAKVCNRPGDDDTAKCYPLDPDLTRIMATSRDWKELVWAWTGWRKASGNKMQALFTEMYDLQNDAAYVNGYDDGGDYWRSSYETENFKELCARLWKEVRPLYEQLHAYTRRKLRLQYPDNKFPQSGHIPAHLLGDMWAQQWNPIEPIVRPHPDTPSVDVTDEMIKQGYDIKRMFKLSEDFFVSLGMDRMVESFWSDSMIKKPDHRDVVCHASAWDFYNQKNFRIKQCTEINMDWLFTTHHEMGHIVYFQQYKNQPTKFRDGANAGFHEAIGDIMELSVSTPDHLNEIGLLPDFKDSEKLDLNFLMEMALRKVSFIPFGYLIDLWRWDVFDGHTSAENYNKDWWKLRCATQGVSPPVNRSASDFDPGAKYHIPNNVPYIRYFISRILQFQIHKKLCAAAGNTGPLHRCNIYSSEEAGAIMRALMEPGSSMPWPDVLEAALGTRKMSAQPILEYFEPLLTYLKAENEAAEERIGWDDEC